MLVNIFVNSVMVAVEVAAIFMWWWISGFGHWAPQWLRLVFVAGWCVRRALRYWASAPDQAERKG